MALYVAFWVALSDWLCIWICHMHIHVWQTVCNYVAMLNINYKYVCPTDASFDYVYIHPFDISHGNLGLKSKCPFFDLSNCLWNISMEVIDVIQWRPYVCCYSCIPKGFQKMFFSPYQQVHAVDSRVDTFAAYLPTWSGAFSTGWRGTFFSPLNCCQLTFWLINPIICSVPSQIIAHCITVDQLLTLSDPTSPLNSGQIWYNRCSSS